MPHLLLPNANFIPTSTVDVLMDRERSALRWNMAELNNVVTETDYDGIELLDSNVFAHNRELHGATPIEAQQLGRMIVSVHESWVDTNPVPKNPEARREPVRSKWLERWKVRAAFPTAAQSLDRLETLEQKLERDLDYVMFPDPKGDPSTDQIKSSRFPRSAIQPTIDVAAAWGVDSPEGFADELEVRGYKVVWDHFHGDRAGKFVDARMKQTEYLPVLLRRGLVRAIHIGLWRIDFRTVDPQRFQYSVDEGAALLNNSDSLYKYPISDTFAILRDFRWQGNVTVEALLRGMEAALNEGCANPRKIARHEMTEYYRAIGQAIRTRLPQIDWELVG